MRLLITGANGQLGQAVLLAGLARQVQMVGLTSADLDVTDRGAVRSAVERHGPDVLIHCAAWTAVDACEADPARAELVNGQGVANVVAAADAIGAHVIHLSTDYVFDGTKVFDGTPAGEWVETDPPNPQTAYGRSKLAGERAAADHTIVRTSWVSGAAGNNIVKTILRLGESDSTLRFVDDQVGKPTFTADLAEKLFDLAAAPSPGIYHITNEGPVSWFSFARDVMAAGGFDPERVIPVATSDEQPPRPARRPANSALANRALLERGFGPPMRNYREPLAELVRHLRTTASPDRSETP